MGVTERLIMRVAWLQHYGWNLDAIRAEVLPECGLDEGLFFLVFQAALLID